MSFLDDIGDAVKDVASTVGDGIGSLAEDAFSTVLSPAQDFAMKGLGAAGSTVASIFGDLEITDIGDALGTVGELALPVMGVQLALAREIAGNVLDKNPALSIMEGKIPGERAIMNSITEKAKSGPLDSLAAKEFNQGLAEVASMWTEPEKAQQPAKKPENKKPEKANNNQYNDSISLSQKQAKFNSSNSGNAMRSNRGWI